MKREHTGNPAAEASDLNIAIAAAIAELRILANECAGEATDSLGFEIAVLEDAELAAPCWHLIGNYASADGAWTSTLDKLIDVQKKSNNEYIQSHFHAFEDIRDRVLGQLHAVATTIMPKGHVIMGQDLTTSQFLAHDWSLGGAIVLRDSSAANPIAMLARGRGVPMVVQAKELPQIFSGEALVNGAEGVAVLNPASSNHSAA